MSSGDSQGEFEEVRVGERLTLDIERVAHGGHFISHARGLTFFVRGAITGEQVIAEVTEVKKRIAWAEVVEVIKASEHRKEAPCHYFQATVCGGCDFQHIDLAYQRELKAQVVIDSFRRIAGMHVDVECSPASKEETGFHWRTRMDFTLAPSRRLALHPHRSDALTEITSCLIAREEIDIEQVNQVVEGSRAKSMERVRVGVADDGSVAISTKDRSIGMRVGQKQFPISLTSFWQPHSQAANILSAQVEELLDVRSGDRVLDLYGGVGLFTAFLRDRVGDEGSVILMESDPSAIVDSRRIFGSDRRVSVIAGRVEQELPRVESCDLVVLDPPRVGVTNAVIDQLVRLRPRQILYISCDPATLARDAKALTEAGYSLAGVRAFDLFPMTEHIESVANFILDR